MKKQIYKIDRDGFVSGIFVGEFDDDGKLISPKGDYITIDLPQPLPFYRPRWNGTKWVEGTTQEEIDELTNVEPGEPTQEERIRDLETMVNLLLIGGL